MPAAYPDSEVSQYHFDQGGSVLVIVLIGRCGVSPIPAWDP